MNRKEYLNNPRGTEGHREYYAQFVTEDIKQKVLAKIGRKAILSSTDPYFNDIGLAEWDALFGVHNGRMGSDIKPRCSAEVDRLMREMGDYPTLAGLVCIAKEAARQIKEQAATESNQG